MKTLILQRHAKAEKLGESDLLRALTPTGITDAAMQGEALRAWDIYPEFIFHSPAQRAKQTAEIMAAKLEVPPAYMVEAPELYELDDFELIGFLRGLPEPHDVVLIVGHNPAIEAAAAALSKDEIGHLRPSEAVILTFAIELWSEVSRRTSGTTRLLTKPE